MVLLNLAPPPPPFPEGSAAGHFMTAFATTGYLKFVKLFEVIGGLLVAIPKTRRAGLLVLGPIMINILAFHGFITHGEGLLSPLLLVLCALTLFLVWVEQTPFKVFLCQPCSSKANATSDRPARSKSTCLLYQNSSYEISIVHSGPPVTCDVWRGAQSQRSKLNPFWPPSDSLMSTCPLELIGTGPILSFWFEGMLPNVLRMSAHQRV